MPDTTERSPILLFDGVCNLCNASVQFVIRHDKKRQFRFASLQSEQAQNLLIRFDLPPKALDSVVLIDDGKAFTRSSAALEIARKLGGIWAVAYIFIVVPRPVRDAVYDWVARNRYRWFGKKEACMVPTPELKNRFI
jgi:predicted DCC family thiol-disulfide oxidoreductase YuxK